MRSILLLSTFLTPVFATPTSFQRRIVQSQPLSTMMVGVCSAEYACTGTDATWPTTGFACSTLNVSEASLRTVINQGVLLGQGVAVDAASWPASCLTASGALRNKYDQGDYNVFYSVDVQCTCAEGVYANCTAATTLNEASCNFATHTFCSLTEKNGGACTAV